MDGAPRGVGLDRRDLLLALFLGVLALALYARTLAPSVVALDDDSLEFQLVALRGAIPHPTGYPLYAVLLTLAVRLIPLGDVAFRANLLSAFFASLAVALTVLVARALGMRRAPAVLAAALFAVAPTVWAQATLAEVYALHLALVAAFVLSALLWVERLAGAGVGETESPIPCSLFASLGFILGLGLAHHRTLLLWLPAVFLVAAWGAWRAQRWPTRRQGLALVLAAALPLLFYAWLPLRAVVGSIDGTYEEVGFGCWVTACQYTGFFADNARAVLRSPAFFGALTLEEIGGWGLALAGIGIVWGWRRSRAGWGLLVGGSLANALFAALYRVPDPEVFWLPVVWGLALLAGWGADALIASVARLARGARARPTQALVGALLLVPVLWQAVATFPEADRSGQLGPPTRDGEPFNGRDVLAQPLPDDAVIVGLLGEITYLRYLQEAETIAPAVATAGGDDEAARWRAVARALAAGQWPFLTRPLAGAGERFSLSALGPLVEVRPEAQSNVPAALWPLEQPVTPELTLAAWGRSPIPGDERERVTLAWRVEAPIEQPLHVSARLVGADDAPLCDGCSQDRPPLRSAYPTTQWRPGEVILDTYELPAPPPGARYLIILYDPASGREAGRASWAP